MFFNCFLKSNQNSSFILCNCFFTFLSFILLFEYCSSKTNVPSTVDIKEWANSLELRLAGHLENISGIKALDSRYADVSKANVLKVEGLEMAKDMARELNENFNKKKQALINLVNTAEEAVGNYHDKPLTIGDVSWVDVDDFKENDSRLTYDERFKKGVNMSYSGVHIPLEIYEGYQEILNGLNWSSALDVTFAENQRRDPNLLWQYFGSQAGFMRQYPASKWNRKQNIPDLYDVRRRPWYIHGSSSPKDMLILMDTSGSMHGQTMDIMRNSVKNILDTLGEDDFVNVAKFNNVTNWVSCFDTFVQATWRNKYTLIQEIDNLKDNQMAKLQIGLNFSFAEFDKFEDFRSKPNNHWVGANCHKVIVIFTDGGTEDAGDIVKKWNRDKRIRIFTFAVGPHPVPYATLKQVACKNKGYFSSIPSMGATRTRVQIFF